MLILMNNILRHSTNAIWKYLFNIIGYTVEVLRQETLTSNLNVQKNNLTFVNWWLYYAYLNFIITEMKFNPYTGITWSLLELAGLLEDEDSHVYFEKIKKHLGLHPFHLTNLSVALNEILHSSINSYDSELQGFLLSYKNPKLLTALGDTFYDSCFIHVDIEADFYVFRPKVGHIVKGIVNKKGYNHIGVLVHKAFNVSIPKIPSAREWPGDLIEIGQEVKFTITHIDLTSRLPFIRGSIDKANYLEGCKLPIEKKIRRRKTTNTTNESFYERDNDSDNSCDSNVEKQQTQSQSKELEKLDTQISPEKYSQKKRRSDNEDIPNGENKKRSKKRLKISQELNHSEYEVENNASYESSNDNSNVVNDTDINTSNKKKKRSEKNSKKKSLEGSQISEPEFDYSSVKIKVEKDVTSNSDTETELKKHKKKVKRESKKLKYSDSANCSVKDEEIQNDVKLEHKRHSKKRKLSNSDINDSRIEIKIEESPKPNNSIEHPLDKDNDDTTNHRKRKSSEKRIKKSITDSESEFGNIKIKEEKHINESEHTQEDDDRKDKLSKIIKKETFTNKSSHSENNTENENYPNGSPTKHRRKREKTPAVEENFGNVTIKEEKLDNCSNDYTPQSKKSSKNKSIDNVNDEENHEYDTQGESNRKKSRKKSKEITIKTEPQDVRIKIEEENIKSEKEDKETSRATDSLEKKRHKTSPKKHSKNESFKNNPADNSTIEGSEEDTKCNVFSPTKRSKKSKEPRYEILSENVKIKIERSSSMES